MPNRSWISFTIRVEVQRVARKLNAVASFASHSQTWRSCVAESFESGPGCGQSLRPSSPSRRYPAPPRTEAAVADLQRRRDRLRGFALEHPLHGEPPAGFLGLRVRDPINEARGGEGGSPHAQRTATAESNGLKRIPGIEKSHRANCKFVTEKQRVRGSRKRLARVNPMKHGKQLFVFRNAD